MEGGKRSVVSGVHGLKHVESLAAAAFADDDAVGAHAQGVFDEGADGDFALAFDVDGAGFEADNMVLAEAEFGGVLDGDDAFVGGNEGGEDIEEGGFAGAGAAGDDDVLPVADGEFEEGGHLGGEGVALDEVVDAELVGGELADIEGGAVEGDGLDDGVDAGAVREAAVDNGGGFVDAAADGADDALDDGAEFGGVVELAVGEGDLAFFSM